MSYRWQQHKEQVSHADDWLMTYADMITLLLCFFALFLSISIPKKDVPPPTPPPVEQVQDRPEVIRVPSPHDEELTGRPDILEGNLPFHGLEHVDEPKEKVAEEALAPIRTPALPEIVDHLKAQGANIDEKGDRITTIDISSAAFFASGLATISDAGKTVLKDVAANIKSDKYKDYQVTVEGHTDDSPIKTPQFPSNWELSTARASAVVKFFLEQGISAQKLRAAGYADTFPKVPNRDASGNPLPANQAQNRRVVIKLEKIDKAE
jgi:chemotaxis protein MotB